MDRNKNNKWAYNSKNEKRVLNAFWMASQTHRRKGF